MSRALELAAGVRTHTSPNPWVGAVVVDVAGEVVGEGATAAPGGPHAEAAAVAAAGGRAEGGSMVVTLEPCVHHGRTGPCVEALLTAGVRRVVIGLLDPDERVNGRGAAALRASGVEVVTGVLAAEGERLLKPYLVHRRTLRPFVVLKLAATLDGRLAAPDGSSRWITGPEARADVQRLRSESDAVLVGAGTVRADDPELTIRPSDGAPRAAITGDPSASRVGSGERAGAAAGADAGERAGAAAGERAGEARALGRDEVDGTPQGAPWRQPLRVVLGRAADDRRVQPALELSGDLRGVVDDLGRRGILQLLVEGGSHVAGEFHRLGLVNRYVFYLAPAILGGDDGIPVMSGSGAQNLQAAWRGRITAVERLGDDVRVEVEP